MTAAHGGFGSERVPLGGGAAVFERLCLEWSNAVPSTIELETLGAGPLAPPGVAYHQLAEPRLEPSRLGALEYSRFCRQFEVATTEHALKTKPDLVLTHDISEGPNLAELSAAGIPVATIFHVDVVDIFSRLYLKGLPLGPSRLSDLYRRTRTFPWPNLLRLVFEKQEQVMGLGQLNIVPSPGAGRLLRLCYPTATSRTEIVGWGSPRVDFDDNEISKQAKELRAQHKIPEDHNVVLTLSRLSPEKAQHRLLEAVGVAENEGMAPKNLTIVVAGAPAFMQGERHARKLRKLASNLNTRVLFPGHVGGIEKLGWYRTADLFVVNSFHESYGLTTLEAMQQACPVVAVQSFGTEATVTPDVGRLVPPGAELPRRLWGEISLLLEPEGELRRKTMAQNAREKASSLTFGAAAKQIQELLKETLGAKDSASV